MDVFLSDPMFEDVYNDSEKYKELYEAYLDEHMVYKMYFHLCDEKLLEHKDDGTVILHLKTEKELR